MVLDLISRAFEPGREEARRLLMMWSAVCQYLAQSTPIASCDSMFAASSLSDHPHLSDLMYPRGSSRPRAPPRIMGVVDFVGSIDIELQSVLYSSSSVTLITCRAVVYACGWCCSVLLKLHEASGPLVVDDPRVREQGGGRRARLGIAAPYKRDAR